MYEQLHRIQIQYVEMISRFSDRRYKSFDYIVDAKYRVSDIILYPEYSHGSSYDIHDICIMKLEK